MAEKKILKTQIMLRYATHEEWLANDPVLGKGEVAVATVATKKDGEVNFVPSVLLKVGDGTNKYSKLDFVFAKAADVLEACKDTEKLTAFVKSVTNTQGFAADSDVQALAGRMTTAEGEITSLKGLVGTKKVETQIAEAIAALNLADTYEAKGTAAGLIEGLDLANTYEAKGTAANAIAALDLPNTYEAKGTADSAIAALNLPNTYEAKGTAAGLIADLDLSNTYEAKGAAASALTEAKGYTDDKDSAMNTRVKALEDKFGDGEENVESQIEAAVNAEKERAMAAEKANADAITAIKDGATIDSFADVESALAGKQAAGDYATKAEAKAYADAKDTAIKAAQDKADANATEIANVKATAEAAYVLPEGGIEEDLSDGVKASLGKADTALQAADIANLATKDEVEAIAEDLDTLSDKVDAEIEVRAEADQKHTDDIAANAAKIATLIGSDADKSVRTIASEELAAQLIAEGADEKLDTLKEIADWIQSHPGDAAAMNSAIQALQAKTVLGTYVDGEETKEYATVKAYVEAAIAALNIGDYALAADLTALAGRVTNAETTITNITKEGGLIDTAVAAEATARDTAIADAIGALDSSVAATAEVDNKVSVLTGITETDGKLTAKTEVTLSAVAKTGNVNDLIQTEGDVLVLFGGDAAGWSVTPTV